MPDVIMDFTHPIPFAVTRRWRTDCRLVESAIKACCANRIVIAANQTAVDMTMYSSVLLSHLG